MAVQHYWGELMKLGRVLFLVALIGVCALAARASDTDTSGSVISDPKYILNGSPCGYPDNCIDLTYTGRTGPILDLTFLLPSPGPISPAGYSCGSDDFLGCLILENGIFCPRNEFCGVSFLLGYLKNGESVTFSSNDPSLPITDFLYPSSLAATPEPDTALLFMTGLVSLSLVGFARKRFRANFVT
jgi:hypothetical protein